MPTDKSEAIQVKGLKELQAALRAIDSELPKKLREANLEAAEVIASKARGRAAGGPGAAPLTAPSIKAAAEQRRAKVSLGGPQFPFAMGVEFGGRGRSTTQQFQPHLGKTGYFVYPTVRDTRDEFMEIHERAIAELTRIGFPD